MTQLSIAVVGKTKEDAEQWAEGRLPQPWEAYSQDDEHRMQGSRLCGVIVLDGAQVSSKAERHYRRALVMNLGRARTVGTNECPHQ